MQNTHRNNYGGKQMAKNIVVFKLYKIPKKYFNRQYFDGDMYSFYEQLLDIAVSHAEKNIKNIDEIIVHRFEAKHEQEMFQHHMEQLHSLYEQGDNNVLSVGNDVIFFEPTDVFSPEYSMFTMSGMNCDVKYWPVGGLSDKARQIQLIRMAEWKQKTEILTQGHAYDLSDVYDPDNEIQWADEQHIYQHMMFDSIKPRYPGWSPGRVVYGNAPESIPENIRYVAQFQEVEYGDFNKDWTAIHFHSSRFKSRPEKMLNIIKQTITKHTELPDLSSEERMRKVCQYSKSLMAQYDTPGE